MLTVNSLRKATQRSAYFVARISRAILFCTLSLSLTLQPIYPTFATDKTDKTEEPHKNNARDSQIGIVVIPDLKAADELGRMMSQEFRRRFADAPDVQLSLQVVHAGNLVDFPKRTSWIINHAKHAETDPRTPNNIEVDLRIVDEGEFTEALVRTEEAMDRAISSAQSLSKEMNATLEQLAAEMRKIEQSALALSEVTSEVETLHPRPLNQHFSNEVIFIRQLIENLLGVLGSSPESWLVNRPWIELQTIEKDLASFLDIWIDQSAILSRKGHQEAFEKATNEGLTQHLQELLHQLQNAQNLKIILERQVIYAEYKETARNHNPQTHSPNQSTTKSTYENFRDGVSLNLRRILGLPSGLTWVMYKLSFTERTYKEHIVEFTSALLQATALFGINYTSIQALLANNPELALNPVAGALTSAGWKLLTGYIERANNAFFVQGINYDPVREFALNQKFFLLSTFTHSIIIGLTVQLATRGVEGFTPDIILHTAWNSFLGIFAKAVPLMLISKHQIKSYEVEDSESQRHSKWKTIAFNFLFSVTYQAIKTIHFFQLQFLNLDVVFVVLGLMGVSYELGKWLFQGSREVAAPGTKMTRLEYKLNRFKQAVTPLTGATPRPTRTCRTLFIFPNRNEP